MFNVDPAFGREHRNWFLCDRIIGYPEVEFLRNIKLFFHQDFIHAIASNGTRKHLLDLMFGLLFIEGFDNSPSLLTTSQGNLGLNNDWQRQGNATRARDDYRGRRGDTSLCQDLF